MSHRTTLKCDGDNDPSVFGVLGVLKPEKAAGSPLPPYLVVGLRLKKGEAAGGVTSELIITSTPSVTNGFMSEEGAASRLEGTVAELRTAVSSGVAQFKEFRKNPVHPPTGVPPQPIYDVCSSMMR